MIPLWGKATPEQRLAAEDYMVAVIRDNGPMGTSAVASEMPRAYIIKCGHDDCQRPEHRQTTGYAGWHINLARRYLDRLVKQGRVVRSETVPAGRREHMWAVPLSVPDRIDAR